ncbi:flagellar hook-associated protein FlgK [Verrucomicrobia bacterium]|nr:flagellar hook-associated protein FlgK [Verrucomicrobiota bacterium]
MAGLTGTINMARNSLQANQRAIELAGHNLANVSNPAYSRQRLNIQTSAGTPTEAGNQGSGVEVNGIDQFRDILLDRQIANEGSVLAYLEEKQKILQFAQSMIGQDLDRTSSSPEGKAASKGVSGQMGLGDNLSEFFNALQALSSNPSSQAYRQVVIFKAQNLSEKFNRIDFRLGELLHDLNSEVGSMVEDVNDAITFLEKIGQVISTQKLLSNANDLTDKFHSRMEQLSKFVDVQFEFKPDADTDPGTGKAMERLNLKIGGVEVIANGEIASKLSLVIKDDKGNKVTRRDNYLERGDTVFVETVKSAEQFQLISGKIKAVIDSRDESVRGFKTSMNLISEKIKERINLAHAKGTSLPVLQLSSEYVGTGSLAIENLSNDLKAGDRLLFDNGGVFTVANDAAIGDKELKGTFVGDSSLAKGERAALTSIDFFDIAADGLNVNERISGNPALLHAGMGGDAGNNELALSMAQIIDERQEDLNGQTFNEALNRGVIGFGQELSSVETQTLDQSTVLRMLQEHRTSISGVSIDEEMANLLVFQRAFQANGKLISLLDELLSISVNLVK